MANYYFETYDHRTQRRQFCKERRVEEIIPESTLLGSFNESALSGSHRLSAFWNEACRLFNIDRCRLGRGGYAYKRNLEIRSRAYENILKVSGEIPRSPKR